MTLRNARCNDKDINSVFVYEIYVVQNMFLVTIFICKQALVNFITVSTVGEKTIKPQKCHYKLRHLVMTLNQAHVETTVRKLDTDDNASPAFETFV